VLTINTLLKRMKIRLPRPVYNAVEQDFFMDILMEETLPLFSTYYPKLIKGVVVTQEMGVLLQNTTNGTRGGYAKYVVPMDENDMYPYIGVDIFLHPYNRGGGGTFLNPTVADASVSRVLSSSGVNSIRYTCDFEEPNILNIKPPPVQHVDFTVDMKQVTALSNIRAGYHETFKKLFEADCKIALYNMFYTAADGGTFGGVEIKDYVSKFEDFESVRQELIDELEATYLYDPNVIETVLANGNSYA
jgi:hypothetical protein